MAQLSISKRPVSVVSCSVDHSITGYLPEPSSVTPSVAATHNQTATPVVPVDYSRFINEISSKRQPSQLRELSKRAYSSILTTHYCSPRNQTMVPHTVIGRRKLIRLNLIHGHCSRFRTLYNINRAGFVADFFVFREMSSRLFSWKSLSINRTEFVSLRVKTRINVRTRTRQKTDAKRMARNL